MINFQKLQKLIIRQAKEKGWGYRKEDLIVSEKISLINTEIAEAYKAILDKNFKDRHGLYEELADILFRTLHLGSAYEVDFSARCNIKSKLPENNLKDIFLKLHYHASFAYEEYRHKRIDGFKSNLCVISKVLLSIEQIFEGLSLENEIMKKLEINKSRKWSSKKLNGNYDIRS